MEIVLKISVPHGGGHSVSILKLQDNFCSKDKSECYWLAVETK